LDRLSLPLRIRPHFLNHVDQEGRPQTRTGQVQMRPVELGVITSKDGIKRRVMFGKEIINPSNLSREEQQQYKDPVTQKLPKTVERDIVVDYDNIENTMLGQSVDARATSEAFNDVSQANKRSKMIIDDRNFEEQYEQAFKASGYATPEMFNQAAAEQGIDIVFNEASKKRAAGIVDPLNR